MRHRKKEFILIMGERLKPYGFKGMGRNYCYYQVEEWGFKRFCLGSTSYIEGFGVGAGAGIRFNALEALTMNSPEYSMHRKIDEQTSSIGGRLFSIAGEGEDIYYVTKPEGFDIALEKVMWHFTEHALPFFEKYSDLETAYQMLRRDDQEARFYSILTHVRACNAVGAAILLEKSKKEIHDLIAEKKAWMVEYDNKFDLNRFNEFLERIKDKL